MQLIQTERAALLPPLSATVGVVERRHTLPILSNLLIENRDGALTLLATDLELQIRTRVAAVDTNEPFAITVAARKLFDIVRALPDSAKLKLDQKDNQVVVAAGKSRFTLQTLPAADYPRMETAAGVDVSVNIPQRVLKRLLQLAQFSMASQDIRYYLNGMLWVLDGKLLRVVATDGHRLACAETELEQETTAREVIVPRKTVVELTKLLDDTDDPVSLAIGANQITLRLGDTELVSKVIDGKFPDYQRVIPQNQPLHLVANRAAVVAALQRAAILSNEKFRGVRLVLNPGTLGVVCNNNEQEEAQDEIEVQYDGDTLDVGFNVGYLLDGLAAMGGETVMFSFTDANGSMLVSSADVAGFKYVVMPMRI